MQERFLKNINSNEKRKLIDNQKIILEKAVKKEIPILVFTMGQIDKTIPELDNIIKDNSKTIYFEKEETIKDGFARVNYRKYNPEDWLNENGVDTVFLIGVDTVACVLATEKGALKYHLHTVTSMDSMATKICSYYCPEIASPLTEFMKDGTLYLTSHPLIDYIDRNSKKP